MKRESCLVCGSKKLEKILDLGIHPFADTFISKSEEFKILPTYSLSCAMCKGCGHVQTISITNPLERYNLFDYSYTSSNSKTSRAHWDKFCLFVINKLKLKRSHVIYEIGSNDGYLLSQFKSTLNCEVLGIDASQSMVKIAEQKNIKTECCVFDEKASLAIVKNYKKCDVVIANNVFNHSDSPLSFLRGVNNMLNEDGHFIFEVPYWKNTVDSKKVDQIYHEHVSYFTVKSLSTLLEQVGMEINFIDVVDYHGGSLRVVASKSSGDRLCLKKFIDQENYLFSSDLYGRLSKELNEKKINFLRKILKFKDRGYKIVAIGAAAKGNTLLNYLNLNNTIVDYATDASKFKQGKKTPLSNVPIFDDEKMRESEKICAIVLSWNLSSAIRDKIKLINPRIEYIDFFKQETK